MRMKANKVTDEQLTKWTGLFEQEPFFTAAGVYFGFPECCIETFIDEKQHDVSEIYPKLDSTGTGYMPCLCCAKEVHENWMGFQEKINANCFATLKFPNDTDELELNEFFIDFTLMLGFEPREIAEQLGFCEDIIDIIDQREGKKKQYKRMKVK
jgi:hypothetical protein